MSFREAAVMRVRHARFKVLWEKKHNRIAGKRSNYKLETMAAVKKAHYGWSRSLIRFRYSRSQLLRRD